MYAGWPRLPFLRLPGWRSQKRFRHANAISFSPRVPLAHRQAKTLTCVTHV